MTDLIRFSGNYHFCITNFYFYWEILMMMWLVLVSAPSKPVFLHLENHICRSGRLCSNTVLHYNAVCHVFQSALCKKFKNSGNNWNDCAADFLDKLACWSAGLSCLSDTALSSQSRLLTAASCQCWELAMQLAVTMVISCLLFVPRGGHFVHVALFTFHPKTAASVICPQFDCDNIWLTVRPAEE